MFLNLTTAPCLLVLFLFFLVILLFHCLLSAIVYCLQAVLLHMTLYHYFLSFRKCKYTRCLVVAVDCMVLHAKSSFCLGHCRSACRISLCVPVCSASLEHTLEIQFVFHCCCHALHVCVAMYAKLQVLQDVQFG